MSTEDENDTNEGVSRRNLLRNGVVAAGGAFGLSGVARAQSTDSAQSADVYYRMVLPVPENPKRALDCGRVSKTYLGCGILITDRTNRTVDIDAIADCNFQSYSPERYDTYEGMILNLGKPIEERGNPLTVDVYVPGQEPRIEIGTPFVLNEQTRCPKGYVGVLAEEIPGFLVG